VADNTGFVPLLVAPIANALSKKKQPPTSSSPPANRPNLWQFLLEQEKKFLPESPLSPASPAASLEEDDDTGATMPNPLVRVRPHPQVPGRFQAYDADGRCADVEGFDPGGGDMTGADDMGYDALLSGIDSDLEDLSNDGDDLGAELDAAQGADDVGASEEKIREHLSRVNDNISKAHQHLATIHGPFAQMKKRETLRKIERLQRESDKLRSELRAQKRKHGRRVAPGTAAASRQGQNAPANQRTITSREAAKIAAAQAAQGARFQVTGSPPGSGRQCELGMYVSGATTPRVVFTVPASYPYIGTGSVLYSEDVPYEKYRITGFRNTMKETSGTTAEVYVENLTTKGNANLFSNDLPTPATLYVTDREHVVGLRDYPEVRSPNVARVTAHIEGDAGSVGDTIAYSAVVMLDEVYDEVFGPGAVGPTTG
jgi:hypothetical protein